MQDPNSPPLATLTDDGVTSVPRYAGPVLSYFDTHATEVSTLPELAAAVSDAAGDPGEEVAIRLHHLILPRLDDSEVLEYDPRSHTARYRGPGD